MRSEEQRNQELRCNTNSSFLIFISHCNCTSVTFCASVVKIRIQRGSIKPGIRRPDVA